MKKQILYIVTLVLLMSTAAHAATDVSFDYQVASTTLTVNGTVDLNTADELQAVTLRVLKSGFTAEQLINLTLMEQKNAIVCLKQVTPNQNGTFSFTYTPKRIIYGNQQVLVTDANGKAHYGYIFFVDTQEQTRLLSALNTAGTTAAMTSVLLGFPYLTDGLVSYQAINTALPDINLLEAVSGMLAGISFTDSAEVIGEIEKAAVVTAINQAQTTSEAAEILDRYQKVFEFDSNNIYQELFLSMREELSSKFINKNYTSAKEFFKDFCDTTILTHMNSMQNYTSVQAILECSRPYLEESNFEGYDALSDEQKKSVHQLMVNGFTDITAMQTAFNKAVKAAALSDNHDSGGASGGSSGSSSGVTLGSVKNTEINENKPEEVFSDLSDVGWAKESILRLYEKKIVSGMEENKFKPLEQVSREQYARMIVTAFDLRNENAACDFEDVERSAWYYTDVASAVDKGLVFGTSQRLFGAGNPITREDMAVIAYRAARERLGDDMTSEIFFDDSEIAEYAKQAVYILRKHGIMQGKDENKFMPKAYATRAEAAKIIDGLISFGGKA